MLMMQDKYGIITLGRSEFARRSKITVPLSGFAGNRGTWYNHMTIQKLYFIERGGGMRIAICDDNILFLRELEKQLLTLSAAENISVFSDLKAFLSSVEEGNLYDTVLMDIDWDENRTGMDAAAELYKLSPETKIIYVTGRNDRYSQHIFLQRANLSGYLTKPVDTELLKANLQKAAAAVPLAEQPSIVLRQSGGVVTIPLREIYLWKARGIPSKRISPGKLLFLTGG
jgi:CheY-like chemotaxis protein